MVGIVKTYKEVDEKISRNVIPNFLYYITPSNLDEERFKKYPPLDFDPDEKIRELNSISVPDGCLKDVYEGKRNEIIYKLEILKNRGRDEVRELSEKLYGKPKKDTVNFAKRILEQNQSYYDDIKIFDAEYLKEVMKKTLENYNIKDWKIEFSEKSGSNSFAFAQENNNRKWKKILGKRY